MYWYNNKGFSGEFKEFGISVNALWPRTTIATAAVKYHVGGDVVIQKSRTTDIIADSAYIILCTKPGEVTGKFLVVS